jgi:hypothetical protein
MVELFCELRSIMLSRLMIDGIVQQTTVLIAALSTAAGIRAPLANVADQVFVELARAIEAQGVGRKVAADMFGMALRTYQKKVLRLAESNTASHRTLWEAVLEYLVDHGTVSRKSILQRFRLDGEENVAAVLNDLVESGAVMRSGRGNHCTYRLVPEDAASRGAMVDDVEMLAGLIWVMIYRRPGGTRSDISAWLGTDSDSIDEALKRLVADGRVVVEPLDGRSVYRAAQFVVPVGSTAGWSGAVFDHFQAVCNAIAAKLHASPFSSHAADTVGGATLGFDVYPGHPHEQEVLTLLRTVRADVNAVWNRVAEYNKVNPVPEEKRQKVYFYMGQYVQDAGERPPGAPGLPRGTHDE